MTVVLRALNEKELGEFLAGSSAAYLADRVEAGDDEALAAAEIDAQVAAMFPGGVPAEGHVVWAVEDGGTRVGSLWVGPAPNRSDALWVWDIQIFGPYRGMGFGREAMRLAEEHARASGARELGLNVFGSNLVARRLYDGLGFEPRSLHMAKDLDGEEAGTDDGMARRAGLGVQFARALAAKDREALLGLFDPALDFRALTPRKPWESSSAAEVVDDIILGTWFDAGDAIESLDDVEVGSFADRDKVRYQLRVANADGDFAVEQEAYFTVDDDRINWIRILCSGYCPVEGAD